MILHEEAHAPDPTHGNGDLWRTARVTREETPTPAWKQQDQGSVLPPGTTGPHRHLILDHPSPTASLLSFKHLPNGRAEQSQWLPGTKIRDLTKRGYHPLLAQHLLQMSKLETEGLIHSAFKLIRHSRTQDLNTQLDTVMEEGQGRTGPSLTLSATALLRIMS